MSPSNRYGVISGFPAEERETIWRELVAKSGGVCQLCEDPIDVEADDIIIEHKDNNGPTEVHNLYIAHRSCNSLKRDLSYDEAKLMIKSRKFFQSKAYRLNFDNILDKYVPNNRKPIKLIVNDDEVTLVFSGEHSVKTNLMIDPATNKGYCFADVPIECIHNDVEVQPRLINWNHVWLMLVDFMRHPVHEPSSCRIQLDTNQVGKLLQFDGQHKTTAQIILGRKAIQTKIYIGPDVTLVRELVLTIQNRIPKMRLAPAIHLEKMQAVYLEKLESSGATSERDFVNSYLLRDRGQAKKEVYSSIYSNIHLNTNNRISKYIQPEGTRGGLYPLSMNLSLNYILKSLVCQELQTAPFGGPLDYRIVESENVLHIINIIADEMLEGDRWSLESEAGEQSTDHLKAVRFFKSGAVRYWTTVLHKAILQRLSLLEHQDESMFLCRPLDDTQRELVKGVILRLTNHPIWTDDDGNIDSKLNENKGETSETLFMSGTPNGYPISLGIAYLLNISQ